MRHRFGKTMGRLVLASAAVACLILPDLASAQADGAVAFDIAPQELDAALTRLADQAGLHLLFPSRDLAGRRSAGLSGRYSPAEALTRLLAGSGYSWRFGPDNSVVLEKAPEQGGAMTLSPVQVEGQTGPESPVGPGSGYVARQSATAAKTDTPLAEIPQSVSVVTRQQMDDQDVQNVAQALRYTPGVLPELRGSWTRYDQFSSRGFELDSNEFLDGLRLLPGYQATPQIDSYFLDRIEVLKGPASVLYGSMAPGGMLNMISKRPTSDPYHEVGLQTGSHGDVEGTVDLGGPLDANGDLLYRFTALGRDGGAQVDHEKNQRIAVAPALTWKPDADDTLTVLASFQSDPKGGFYDFLPYQGSVVAANGVKIPTDFYMGDLDYSAFRRSQYSLTYLYEHRFDETWTVRQTLRAMHIDAADFLLQGEGWDTAGSTLARYAWSDRENVNSLAFDNQAQAKFETGPLTHTVLFGVDVQRNDADEKYGSGGAPDLSLAEPNYYLPVASFANQRSFDQVQTQTGLYAQDQIRFGRWAVLAGVRQDWAETDVDGKIGLASSTISNSATTGRVGLVYLFDNGLAPYAGYSTSFDPQAGSYYDGTPFQPTTGRQYEVGMKYQPPGSNSFVTLAAFDLTEQNVPTADPDPDHGPYAQVETGEIRSRGIELEGHASLTDDLSLVGAYSYMDPKVTEDTDYQGRQPVQIPRNTASGWADYTLHQGPLSGLGFGAGIRFIGSTYADQDNTLKVPSFTLVDAALRYDLGRLNSSLDGALLSVNASNLFDRTYVSSCDSAYTCYYGLRRTVYANLKYRF